MKLSDIFERGLMTHRKAKLLIDIELDNGESRKVGDEVSVLIDYNDGHYHIEHNEFACKAHESEIEFI